MSPNECYPSVQSIHSRDGNDLASPRLSWILPCNGQETEEGHFNVTALKIRQRTENSHS
jgi:hypothetical protein